MPSRADVAGAEAKIEILSDLLFEYQGDLNKYRISRETLNADLQTIEASRQVELANYDRIREEIVVLESALVEQSQVLRKMQARDTAITDLIRRFTLLDVHYDSDIERLNAMEETGSLLEALPTTWCPVCGSDPSAHSEEHLSEHFSIQDIRNAARTELQRVGILKNELRQVIDELLDEQNDLQSRIDRTNLDVSSVQSRIEQILLPRIRETAALIEAQVQRRETLVRAAETIARMEQISQHLQVLSDEVANQQPIGSVSTSATSAEMNDFAVRVKHILDEWNYADTGQVFFRRLTKT